jgi:hypothetical protein
MMPHMLIVNLCLAFMYLWPSMTLWPPEFLYGNQAATAARPSQANRRRHP